MNYTTWSTDELVTLLKMNLGVMAGGLKAVLGDDPIPDIREVYEHLKNVTTEDFMTSLEHDKGTIGKSMDVFQVISIVQGENIEIQKELLTRI